MNARNPSKPNIPDKIVATKREEIAHLLPKLGGIRQAAAGRKDYRDFAGALRKEDGVALVAEVKKASPSAGIISPNFDAIRIARDYEAA